MAGQVVSPLNLITWFAVSLILLDCVSSRVIRHSARTPQDQLAYLRRYGYLSSSGGQNSYMLAAISSGHSWEMSRAISKFQRMAGITATGRMNDETMRMMERPRCGVPDNDHGQRMKRYALHGTGQEHKWKSNRLTYKFHHFTNDLSRSVQRRIVHDAFKKWSDKANLSFRERSWLSADIDIIFAAGEHCAHTDHSFDGPGGTLAHAFFPLYGGDIHFDDDEKWAESVRDGTNLLYVATHEIGHSLGLRHSENQNAVMTPFYTETDDVELHSDDIEGIRALYGSK